MSEFDFGSLLKPEEEKKTPLVTPTVSKRTVTPPRKRENYQAVTKGDLVNILSDACAGKVKIKSDVQQKLKRHFGQYPFGGARKGAGGWNTTAYAIFEVLLSSEKFFIKTE